MRFAVFTHVIHKQLADRLYAYSPYVREMNLWFKNVKEVEIIAPALQMAKKKHSSDEPYKHSNIVFIKIPSFHLLNFPAVLDAVIKIPFIFFKIVGAMRRADHLHLRCPGNIGLLAAISQIFFPKKPKTVKYAGNWDPKAKQPWTYKLQRKILSNTFLSRNIKVLVYGNWTNQSTNILPFFTASFSEKERESTVKNFKPPYKFIFTGNLVKGKGIFKAIKLIETLKNRGLKSELEIYGDGILKDSIHEYIQRKNFQNVIELKGRKSLEELKEAYKKAHFVILLSKSEGWPKTIAEGMWYGCIPIASAVSCVPWMLNAPPIPVEGPSLIIPAKRGILLSNRLLYKLQDNGQFKWFQNDARGIPEDRARTGFSQSPEDTSREEIDLSAVVKILKHSENLREMSRAGQEISQQYTLERFEAEIKKLLVSKKT
ncbi:glycosyltransferase involved in cell wall biosynthesis [Salegentibacter sp. 24]|uniref:glycosyltransferase n=1 Tax=Salegentibacter sp. 24 TaxID=2183986 RepID=UPI0010621DD0|nr:glycosyltransferase [Salegentibacter sp. 24]TDN89170.1 glycosyltransferase involved in cell wall biosynthesis [Salegentibacter sp. 24]